MATSGTATFNPDFAEIAEEAFDMVGVEYTIRTNAGNTSTQTDTTLNRISVATYATIPNKLSKGKPIQIYIDRAQAAPVVYLYPVPDDAQTYTLFYYRIARVEDVGSPASNTLDLPARFIPCATAGLAYYLSLKHAEIPEKVIALKALYDEQWQLAADEDREKASVRFVPYGGYN